MCIGKESKLYPMKVDRDWSCQAAMTNKSHSCFCIIRPIWLANIGFLGFILYNHKLTISEHSWNQFLFFFGVGRVSKLLFLIMFLWSFFIVPIHFHCKEKSSLNIVPNISLYVPQKKESQAHLERQADFYFRCTIPLRKLIFGQTVKVLIHNTLYQLLHQLGA